MNQYGPSTFIEISKSAFENNIIELKKIINLNSFALVVKSNAYGHGLKEIGYLANNLDQIDYICTASLREAITLRKNGVSKKILVLSFIDLDIELAINKSIEVAVYDLNQVILINQIAANLNKNFNIHIKVDTGLSRLGVLPDQTLELIKKILKLKNINIIGVFTHLSDTSNPDQSYSYNQIDKFNFILDSLEKNNINIKFKHVFASSSLYLSKNLDRFNMIRIGALAYGAFKSEFHKSLILNQFPGLSLQPVLKLKTKVRLNSDKIYIPIGYFQGYSKNLENAGFKIDNNFYNKKIKIYSNYSCLNITGLNINPKSEVTLIDDAEISSRNIAQKANIIVNELLTNLSTKIPRIIV